MFENRCIVIDYGTYSIKSGFSGLEGPNSIIYSEKRRTETDYNWFEMETLLDHVFSNELRVIPEDYNVLLTEAPMNSNVNRKMMAKILFDTFNVKGLFVVNQCVLSLYSAGQFTGIVCESGHYASHFVPIFDNYLLSNSYCKMNFGGKDITNSLDYDFAFANVKWSSSKVKTAFLDNIKKQYCYVALDVGKELKSYKEQLVELPDGNVVKLKDQRFMACEILFHKDLDNNSFDIRQKMIKDYKGFSWYCNSAICNSDIELRKELYQNIFLAGGSTLFPGFKEKLIYELKEYYTNNKVNVIPNNFGIFATWIGGSIVAPSPSFTSRLITRDEWWEYGNEIVQKKYFN